MKFIFTGFSPNTSFSDVTRAFTWLLQPWRWSAKDVVEKLEYWFREYFLSQYAVAFDSGRSALEKSLQAGGIKAGDEVILQAFTCVVVANAITHLGAVPLYVDCLDDYTLDPTGVEPKITSKTKAIIIQHTFGAPAHLEELLVIAKTHNLVVIEDCAHSLGAMYKGQLLGTFGDLAMFSFGSDKVISGVRGGMVITNNKKYGEALKNTQRNLPRLSFLIQLQHLLHPIFFFLGKKTYHLLVGKIILFAAQKLRLINRIIDPPEKQGTALDWFPAQLPNPLASLAFEQIKNLDPWNKIRQTNAAFYARELMNKLSVQKKGTEQTWLRFPIQVSDVPQLREKARRNNIILGDWYSCPIAPGDSSPQAAGYVSGSCPNAEKIGQSIVNLPTDPLLTQTDRERVIALFNE